MAITAPSTTPSSSATPALPEPIDRSIDIRAARPIPLTAAQEGQVRSIYYKRVRGYCSDEIRDFAHCATGRTFTIPIVCRQERLRMNTCMNAHATRAEEDAAREEWWRTIPERRKAHEEEERWKEEQRQKKREWWGVDKQGRPIEGGGAAGGEREERVDVVGADGRRYSRPVSNKG